MIMITLKVEVTSEDVAQGYPGDCGFCPIALAANRAMHEQMPEFQFSSIVRTATLAILSIDNGEPNWIASNFAELPSSARDFIEHFDKYETADPFTFEIDLVFTSHDNFKA